MSKVNYLEIPKQLNQFLFEQHISMKHVVIGLSLYFITLYFKEIIQIFIPVVVILYFLQGSMFSGEKSNVNHFHFHLSNDHSQFDLIEKIKSLVESDEKNEFNTDTINKLNQIFDPSSYSYKYNFVPHSNLVNENMKFSVNEIPPTVTSSNVAKSTATSTVNVLSSNSKISTTPTFTTKSSVFSTATSLPVSSSMSVYGSANMLNSKLLSEPNSHSVEYGLDSNKGSIESSMIVDHKVLNKEIVDFTDPISPVQESEATLKLKPISIVDNFTQCDFLPAESSSLNINMSASIKESIDLLPQFSGSFKEYRQFKTRFETIVDHLNHTDTSKGLLLYMSLSSEVILSIKSPIVDGIINYQYLWKLLDKEYYRPQYGLLYHGAALNSLTDWDVCDTLEKLGKLYKFLLLHHRALERGGELGKGLSVGMIVASKLEGELLSKVCEVLGSPSENSVLEDILFQIKDHINFLEVCELASSDSNKKFQDKIPENKIIPKSCLKTNPQVSNNCLFCHQSTHVSHDCNVYSKLSDFQKVIYKNFSCFNCLNVGHKSYACPKATFCTLCNDNRKHSPVLCSTNYNS